MLDFVSISLVDILDIILVGLLIFQIIRLIRGTAAMSIFAGILLLYVIWLVVSAFNMKLLSSLMGQVLGVGVIALIVIFQPEISRFLLHLGSRYASAKRGSFFRRFFKNRGGVNVVSPELLEELTEACRMMSQDHPALSWCSNTRLLWLPSSRQVMKLTQELAVDCSSIYFSRILLCTTVL